ncbi:MULTISPECIES: MFS transporter [Actinomadura]|uniref:MFS transporter n=1 Tax=Actinomadura litoris TaxID=2678616 RepID=A0A7K1L5D2_9ACTN|nr:MULTISPECIES: MFS transporter [Actinomadura]MBT2212655.1 MFS transporter [Actinomadura sp. NEAU-AAG7]MUN39632.1 MFS transporter [Actinomadura litoris]
MYLSTLTRPGRSLRGAGPVAANVVALGAVSLITDVSAEMVTAILPLYLVVGLQFSPAAYGAIDGLYTGATVLLRLAGGYVSDLVDRRKPVALLGYAASAAAKLGLLAAAGSGAGIGLALTADRAGKGLRTAPRDALITLCTPPEQLGRAFGVHRTMDAAGAFAGPLVALAVLAAAPGSYDSVIMTSFCVALLGVLVLVLFVRDAPGPRTRREALRWRELLRGPAARRLLPASFLLGLATIGDGFTYLLVAERADLALGWFPLLAVATSGVYLLLATPAGMLADRAGRLPVVLGGYLALTATYLLLALASGGGLRLVGATVVLHGVFYAATDGGLMALAGPLLPAGLRTTGIALVQSGQALAYLVSSVLFGAAWQVWGTRPALLGAAAVSAIALAGTAAVLRPSERAVH